MNVERFVAAANIDGREVFAFLTTKIKNGERKLYSVELMDKKKLLSSLDTLKAEARRDTPVRSFEKS